MEVDDLKAGEEKELWDSTGLYKASNCTESRSYRIAPRVGPTVYNGFSKVDVAMKLPK